MTQTERKQLDRTFRIAVRVALRALRGTSTRDGQPVYAVLNRTSTRQTGTPTYHILRVDGQHITCDCPAHQNGRVCAHRAAVRAAIQAEHDAAAERAADARWYREMLQLDYPAPGFQG